MTRPFFLFLPCADRGKQSLNPFRNSSQYLFKVFFKCCSVFTLSSVSSSFGNVENNIQFCAAFVCPFPCGKHGLFPPCFLQTFSQLSFSCLLPCQRRHWWCHSKSRNKVFAAFPSCLLLRLVLCCFCIISDLAHLLIPFIYFLRKADAFFPPYQHMLKVKALKWVSGDLDSHPDLSVHQLIIAISWEWICGSSLFKIIMIIRIMRSP